MQPRAERTRTPGATVSTPDRFDAAVRYAGHGWHVVPLHAVRRGQCACWAGGRCGNPGEHPLTLDGREVPATADPTRLRQYLVDSANVGLVCGPHSGIAVVDVDRRNGGGEALAVLLAANGPLPDTAEVATGGGDRHFYFTISQKTPKRALAPGVVLLGDGATVCAPPSLHVSGSRYQWVRSPEEAPPAPLPAWMAATRG